MRAGRRAPTAAALRPRRIERCCASTPGCGSRSRCRSPGASRAARARRCGCSTGAQRRLTARASSAGVGRERGLPDLARRRAELALEHAGEVGGVAESPAEGDVGHRAAVGALQVLQAAGQPLACAPARPPRRRRPRTARAAPAPTSRRRARSRPGRAPDPGGGCARSGAISARIAARVAERSRGQVRLDRGAQQLERRVGGRGGGRRLELGQLERERVHVADEQPGACRCRPARAAR